MNTKRFIVPPGTNVKFPDYDPNDTTGVADKQEAEGKLAKLRKQLSDLQSLLYAEHKHALLVVLQALDAGGKDGTIRHIFTGVNPQGCNVTAFKVPTPEEADHDFLWRIHKAVPPVGMIGIFNRSHYESVLIERVHNLVPKEVWKKRYGQINAFEEMLSENRVHILKFFLHISKDEQKRRIEARIHNKAKNWKMNLDDIKEREHWDDYQVAFADAIGKCSTSYAPWYIVPANKKWFRNVVISQVIVDCLKSLDMQLPKGEFDPNEVVVK
jgi:PPK2 family polyphosphate:nucleotide phosphotransferase